MGAVYLARHRELDRLVALKVLRDEIDDPSLVERFAREARSVARLDHPHIVRIYDFGYHEGRPFLAMEYVEGETLSHWIRAGRTRSLAQAFTWMEELCDGLAQAHDAGIIHRDIKPANLIVTAAGMLKILDFGIARLTNQHTITETGALIGTLNYMSPEQIGGRPVDARSDVFGVGAVFYELITGRLAFPGTSPETILHAVLHTSPQALAEAAPGVDGAVQSIVDRALAKNPADRFASVRELRRALIRAHPQSDSLATTLTLSAEHSPVDAAGERAEPAGPPSIAARLTTTITRHKKTTAAAGALLVALAFVPLGNRFFERSPPAAPPPAGADAVAPAAPKGADLPVPPGVVVVDATPWAELQEIVRRDGTRADVPEKAITPLRLELAPGEYTLVLKGPDGDVQRLAATVTSGAAADLRAQFRTVDPSEYLKRKR
jgi:serine/threonine-protein kinase